MNQVRINERDIWMVACGTHHTIVLAKHFSTTDTELKKLLRIQQNLLRALACLKVKEDQLFNKIILGLFERNRIMIVLHDQRPCRSRLESLIRWVR